MLAAALRDRTPWFVALFVLLAVFTSPCLSLGDISSEADFSRRIHVGDPFAGSGVEGDPFIGQADQANFIGYGGDSPYDLIVDNPTPANHLSFGSGSFSLVGTIGGELTVTGFVGTLTGSFPSYTFHQLDSYTSTLLDGTVVAFGPGGVPGLTWYLVDLDGGSMESVFGSQVLVAVDPTNALDKGDVYGVVPEPSGLMVWGLLGPAGFVVGAFASRRRRLSKQQ
jgi:hypothetical protein